MTKENEQNKNQHEKDSLDSFNMERKSQDVEPTPSSISQGLIRLVWKSKWRKYYLLIFLPFMLLYIIWETFPDRAKENLLRKVGLLDQSQIERSIQDINPVEDSESRQSKNDPRTSSVSNKFINIIRKSQIFNPKRNSVTVRIVPIAELKRGNKFIIFLWPIPVRLKDNVILDDDIYAVHMLIKTNGSIEMGKVEKTSTGSEQLLLDYTVRERYAGVPLSDLGPKFISNMKKFSTAMSERDLYFASKVAADMTRLFELHAILFDDMVTEILINSMRLKPGEIVYSGIKSDGKNTFIEFQSSVTEQSKPFRIRAVMVNEQKGLWVFAREE